jgi:hypothetical protein
VQDERDVPLKCDTSITCVPVFSSEMFLCFWFYHKLYHVHSFSRNYPLISRNYPCCTCCIGAAFFAWGLRRRSTPPDPWRYGHVIHDDLFNDLLNDL